MPLCRKSIQEKIQNQELNIRATIFEVNIKGCMSYLISNYYNLIARPKNLPKQV